MLKCHVIRRQKRVNKSIKSKRELNRVLRARESSIEDKEQERAQRKETGAEKAL
jgi:hypothetical protein